MPATAFGIRPSRQQRGIDLENRYCTQCKQSRRCANNRDGTYTCQSCGHKLLPKQQQRQSFENRLAEALGLITESDTPVKFKHEGLKKKAQKGEHKFDPPPEYVQMKHDNTFGTLQDPKKIG